MSHLMHQIQSHLLGGKNKGTPMRNILAIVLFCFYQSAFAVNITKLDIYGTEYYDCSIDEPTITSTKSNDGIVTYTFTHPIRNTGWSKETFRNTAPRCRFQISTKTQTSNLLGGWKFSTAPKEISLSTNDPNGSIGSLCGTNLLGKDWGIDSSIPSNGADQTTAAFEYYTQNSGCKLSYSITLIKDPQATGGTNKLCPLINFNIEDMHDSSSFYAASLNTKFTTCAVPDVTPTPPPPPPSPICKRKTLQSKASKKAF